MLFRLIGAWVLLALARLQDARRARDRGDVPGWVMVTVKTAPHYTRV